MAPQFRGQFYEGPALAAQVEWVIATTVARLVRDGQFTLEGARQTRPAEPRIKACPAPARGKGELVLALRAERLGRGESGNVRGVRRGRKWWEWRDE